MRAPGLALLFALAPGSVFAETAGIEDPQRSLAPFYAALARSARGETGALTRISHFGDSLTVSDDLTGAMRRRLQARFGDGGHGFVLLGRPWPYYRHHGVEVGSSGRWKQHRVTHPRAPDGCYGLGGVGFRSASRQATAWVATAPEGRAARIEIAFLRSPAGGTMLVVVDGDPVARVPTRAERTESGFFTVHAPDAAHRVEIRTLGDGEVRLFGVVLERDGPGVVYDSLAVAGARAAAFLAIAPAHLREQLARRRPDLVVVGLGTNESSAPGVPADQVEARTAEWLGRLRAAWPSACLVLSPPDRVGSRAGGSTTPASLLRVVDAQRRAALGAGCAFFDTFEAMGGQGSMRRWARRGLAAADRRHLREPGAEALATLIESALLAGVNGGHSPGS